MTLCFTFYSLTTLRHRGHACNTICLISKCNKIKSYMMTGSTWSTNSNSSIGTLLVTLWDFSLWEIHLRMLFHEPEVGGDIVIWSNMWQLAFSKCLVSFDHQKSADPSGKKHHYSNRTLMMCDRHHFGLDHHQNCKLSK